MYNENKHLSRLYDSEAMTILSQSSDPLNVHMTGESIDRIYRKGVLVEEIHDHNIVVNSFLNLVMCLMKGETGYSGLQYWAVGSGLSSWDTVQVNPSATDVRLTTGIGRVALDSSCLTFLNSTYGPVTTPSNIIQIKRTFTEEECNGTWREFGIFGGNATTAANSGIMINKRHHKIITKTSDIKVERTMRFVLNLV